MTRQRKRDGGEVSVDGIEYARPDEWDGRRFVRLIATNGRRVEVALSAASARAIAKALEREARWAVRGLRLPRPR